MYGVGHSLGGYLNYLAAVRRPELFRAIVLLDAPIIGAFRGGMLGATKRLGIVDRVTPAGATRDRRSTLASSRDEAKAHFRGRPLFRHFSEECLDDYVHHGLIANHELRLQHRPCDRVPDLSHHPARHDEAPAASCACRRRSSAARTRTWCGAVRLAGMRPKFRMRKVPGGHLFPFERPRDAADAITRSIAQVLDGL